MPDPQPIHEVSTTNPTTLTPEISRRRFGDTSALRDAIYDNIRSAASNIKPIGNARHTIELSDVDYEGPSEFPLARQKEAILGGKTLSRRLVGTWRLRDNETQKVLDEQRMTLAHVPHLTQRGTYILNGTENTLSSQLRLRPGIYTRRKANGDLEAHVNVLPGKGVSHRYFLEPETGIFKVQIGQAKLPAISVLRALGASDSDLAKAWGNELFGVNAPHDSPHITDKLYERVVGKPRESGDKGQALLEAFQKMEVDPEVTRSTLGRPIRNLDKHTILATTKKLLDIHKNRVESDDRDHLAYQMIMGPEDLLAERVSLFRRTLPRLLWQASYRNNLSHVKPGVFNDAINAAFMSSGLGQTPEGISATEFIDHGSRVTRMGEGGIGSADAIPDESRNVHPSHLGVLDLVKTPECFDERTEVYTRAGWKYWTVVSHRDEFACCVDGKLEFHKPTKLQSQLFEGIMYGVRTPVIEYLVTGNHRICLREGMEEDFRFAEASDLLGRRINLASSHDIQEGEPIKFTEISIEDHQHYVDDYFNGVVYCATVPGGFLFVRRNKKLAFWCGNSEHVGVDARVAFGVQKGSDNKLYIPVKDIKSGKIVYRTPQDINKSVIAFPNELSTGRPHVAAIDKGHMHYVPREEALLELPSFEQSFSPLSNLVPLKSASKGQRVSMGARMLTQALPLVSPEVPFVQGEIPGQPGKSFEELYGRHMGAVLSKDAGKVLKVTDDDITVKYNDGTRVAHDLYNHMAGPRKTGVHNTPMVRAGETVQPNQLLAKSNFTNDRGEMAIGRNARIAYVPIKGKVYEDSAVISESFAKNLTSDHYYQHKVDYDDTVRRGLKAYESLFPGKHSRALLSQFDENGIIKKGTTVEQGDPLILVAKAKERTHSQISGGSKSAFTDSSVTWDHHHPGVVTDIVHHRNGVNVVVQSSSPMEVGDKLCYSSDTKVRTLSGWKYFQELLPDDKLLSLAPDGKGEFLVPDAITQYDHDGWMYQVDTEDVSLLVTANHKLYVKLPPYDQPYELVEAHKLVGQQYVLSLDMVKHERTETEINSDYPLQKDDEWVHYKGTVHCATLPRNHVLYVCRDNKPVWCGNSSRFGGKSVVADILPDSKMPHDAQGRPFDMSWSPLSLLSRINSSWVLEAGLGKVAELTGKVYKMADFGSIENLAGFVKDELDKHGLSSTETITDPETGRKIPGVLTGNNYILKLHHTAESKSQARGLGAYSAEGMPARGPGGGAKTLSLQDTHALLAHGATAVLQDAHVTRGGKNEDFWMSFLGGYPPPHGKVPFVYKKFLEDLRAAGINTVREGNRMRLMALTNKDVQSLAGNRELQNAETVKFDKGLEPIKGGLFDQTLTGGHGAESHWAKITLAEPMPNPVFADPIRRLLGLTKQQYEDVLVGKEKLGEKSGPGAIAGALNDINIPKALAHARADIQSTKKTARDLAIRKLAYLKAAEKFDLHPREWILNAVPVLPPAFRPVSVMKGTGGQLVSDANYLYKELFDANQNLKSLKGRVDDVSDERLALYRAFEAVTGLGDPTHPKNVERGVKGILANIFGSTSKYSVVQQKMLGTTVDTAGRAVIAPDPDMDMDHVGLPADKAWEVFKPFVIRRLVRRGVPRAQTLREVEDRSKLATQALTEEMSSRPVLLNRYPLLHKYGLLAAWPKLVTGDIIRLSPITFKGYGADSDGDAMQFHVPVAERAVHDAIHKMMPSRNLVSPSTMKVTAFLPSMEYSQGLHAASSIKDEGTPKVFASAKDAIAAWKRGDIGLGQRLYVVGK